MKKNILLLSMITFSGLAIAQVGINTPNPKSTFDITAKNPTGTARTAEGLLVPRVDRQRAQSMTGVETSTLIYVNSVATGTQSGTASQIDVIGYYYFNGSVWTKIVTDPTLFSDTSIYKNNGTLSANRTVAQADKTLAFTSTATSGTSHFTVDGKTLSVDAVNNRIGMGTDVPQNRLHLGEDAPATVTDVGGKKLAVYNNSAGTSFYGLGISSNTLQMHAGSAPDAAPAMALTRAGYLGLGTPTPTSKLEIVSDNEGGTVANDINIRGFGTSKTPGIFLSSANGTASAPSNLANNDIIGIMQFNAQANNSSAVGSSIKATYKGNGLNNLTDLTFSTSNTDRLKIDENGKIGIGTSSPTNLLHVNSSSAGAVKITDGTQGNNKVLTSDANGVGSWKDLPTDNNTNIYTNNGTLTANRIVTQGNNTLAFNTTGATSGTSHFTIDDDTFNVDAFNNRLGIGTKTPLWPFHVVAKDKNLDAAVIELANSTINLGGPYLALKRNYSDNPLTNGAIPAGASLGAITFDGNTGNGYTGTGINSKAAVAAYAIENFSPTAKGTILTFNTVSAGTATAYRRMTITDKGKVGIGTSSIDAQLHIHTTDDNGIVNERESSNTLSAPSLALRKIRVPAIGETIYGVTKDEYLGAITFAGSVAGSKFKDNTIQTNTTIASIATENFSNSGQGSELAFFTVRNGMTSNAKRMTISNDGKVGIGRVPTTNILEIEGNASKTTAGSWIANSDARLKKDIQEIPSNEALDKLLRMKGVYYYWNDNKTGINRPKEKQIGFIAQNIKEIFPDKVTTDSKGYLQTAYGDYDAILVEAIRALNQKIERLELELKKKNKKK
ncbi:tail fiber domain-containing protein [Chryseobacterium sp. MMS23-Vi53]|uniref:tail fiber domain-containing protein n=1 Tax=Chryseobacterium sp. MMS23-Vi53 TaxID=3386644 RepID=UPI0039E7B63C